ncbi:MAG: DEAD/DEAH box helicase, partial [Gammaproteobacteria bacterium]
MHVPRPSEPFPFDLNIPPELPIHGHAEAIARAILEHPVVIVAGETGSGKTTQLPKIALSLGRRRIACTQPRRIAAVAMARRVAQELGTPLGRGVGYRMRFSEKRSQETRILFLTDGMLLADIHGDPSLSAFDTLIIDEAHERSLNIDFLLGYAKRLLEKRADLKLIISSATLDVERFSRHFGRAPVLRVEGRTFPVETRYLPPEEEDDLPEAVAAAVEGAVKEVPGDILVFLSGERDIREAKEVLEGRGCPLPVLPLHARLSQAEQAKVFETGTGRRVILATNVAETSITLPGVRCVIDTGLARIRRFEPRTGVERLKVEPISQASAEQRRGRAGRTAPGLCLRLYSEEDLAARPPYTDPEILRTSLASAILRMKALGLGDIEDFPFLDAPTRRSINAGYQELRELGALDGGGSLTPLGRQLARLPLEPRIGRMILEAS